MILFDRYSLDSWLSQNSCFEVAGYIADIKQSIGGTVFTVGYHLNGSLNAVELQTLIEYDIKPIGINNWNLANSDSKQFLKDNIEGIYLIDDGFGIIIESDNPIILKCDRIEISEPRIYESVVQPFLSTTISASASTDIIINPEFWIESFKQHSIDIGFRIQFENIKEINQLSSSDYSGYFLQRPDRIELNDQGIFFFSISQISDKFNISLSLNDAELLNEWNVLFKILSNLKGIRVCCGNVHFDQKALIEFISSSKFPYHS